MLAKRHEILSRERAIYGEFDGASANKKANLEDSKTFGAEQLEVSLKLSRLSPVVDGLAYEGTRENIQASFTSALSQGVKINGSQNERGLWEISTGAKKLTIQQIDYRPGDPKLTVVDGVEKSNPATKSESQSLDGHQFSSDFRDLSDAARHVIRQIDKHGWVRVNEIPPP